MADNIKVLNEFLPKAEQARLGAIKIGETLSLDANEVLNVDSASMTGAYMTNCITEIPQDIHYTLNNGILTIKAGTKTYIPNGFETDGITKKFIEYIVESDVDYPINHINGALRLVAVSSSNVTYGYLADYWFSGDVAPIVTGSCGWYDTANNVIKISSSDGSSWSTPNVSLPILGGAYTNSYGFTSITTVFNGFGYVGCTAFALPGIKGLIPNGRKADGALNDIEFCLDKPIIYTFSSDYTGPMVWGINESGLILDAEYFTEQELEPTNLNSNWAWLNPNTNILTWNAWNGSGYTYIPAVQVCIVAKMHRTLGHIDLAEFQKPLRIANVYDVNKKLITLQDTKLDASRIQYVSAIPANPQNGVIYLIAQ